MSIRYAYKESLRITKRLKDKHRLVPATATDLLPPGPGLDSDYEFDLACEIDEAQKKERERVIRELKELVKNCKKFDQEDLIPGINLASAAIELLNE